MTPDREKRFKSVISKRQPDLTIILENVTDPHNIYAVLRTCDAVGIPEVHIVYSRECKNTVGKKSSSSARKWVKEHYYMDLKTCFSTVRKNHDIILASSLQDASTEMYKLDLTKNIALVFGNERDGVSDAALALSDGTFFIPQEGMIKSLNISVACAVTLYETLRQRKLANAYSEEKISSEDQLKLFKEWAAK